MQYSLLITTLHSTVGSTSAASSHGTDAIPSLITGVVGTQGTAGSKGIVLVFVDAPGLTVTHFPRERSGGSSIIAHTSLFPP